MAHNNLLLLYRETRQTDKARGLIKNMRQKGMPVPPAVAAQLGA
jgi:hypothetical protein